MTVSINDSILTVLNVITPYVIGLIYIIVIVFIGWIIARVVQIAVMFLLKTIQLNALSDKIGFTTVLAKGEVRRGASELIGDLAYWIIVIVSFITAIIAVGHPKANELVLTVLTYISVNVSAAILVLVIAVLFAKLIANLVLVLGHNTELPDAKTLAKAIQYAIVVFGLLFGLEQLGIPMQMVLGKLDIIIGAIALAVAIAFGLGCKDAAGDFFNELFRKR